MKKHIKIHENILGRWRRFFSTSLMGLITVLLPLSAVISQPLTPVALGAAGDFAILAGSMVSNVPTSAVTGNIGLSPSAGSYITGFGLTEVTGIIYAVDATGPAGSEISAEMLTSAKADIVIAFNDAAGRTPVPTGSFLNTGDGDIGGMTLIPGLYKFTGGLAITGSNLTLTGSATDVWIFQIASDLVVAGGIQVILAGGALPANIFWQVGTSATLGSTSVFKGIILADQSISMNTGATLDGRALASIAAVTIEVCTVTAPGLTTGVDPEILPDGFNLSQNYPNPFNPSTTISYQLPADGHVSLTITDMLGREVSVLVNEGQTAGLHQIVWDARSFASGTYNYRLQAGSFVSVKQMVLVK